MKKTLLIIIIGHVLFFFGSGCSSQGVLKKDPPPRLGVEKIAVLPFRDMSRAYGENISIRCTLCGDTFTTGKVAAGADEFMTRQTVSQLQSRKALRLTYPERTRVALQDVLFGRQDDMSETQVLMEAGRLLEVDAVFVGRLYRFKDRVGNQYSVESPASVSFYVGLVRVADGQLLWDGQFDEAQQPLFENLFKLRDFFKRKGRWVTAQQLAASGLDKVMEEFPKP